MNTVKINGKKYNFTFDSLLGLYYRFETVTGESFNYTKISHLMMMFWVVLSMANDGFDLELEAYQKAINDPNLFKRMHELWNKRVQIISEQAVADNGAQDEEDEQKKS